VPFLTKQLQSGNNKFLILPLFFARSSALTSFVPEQIKLLEAEFGKIELTVADVVYPLPQGENGLVSILSDYIQQLRNKDLPDKQSIVLVDHGSPSPKVTAVRQHIAKILQQQLEYITIEQAVMERREGSKYDFNGPLLESWLARKATQGEKTAIVVMLFFLPGKHAGAGGDIEGICRNIERKYPGFSIKITPPVAEHAGLVDLLQARLQALLKEV